MFEKSKSSFGHKIFQIQRIHFLQCRRRLGLFFGELLQFDEAETRQAGQTSGINQPRQH